MSFVRLHAVLDSLSKACDAVNSKDPRAVADNCAGYARLVCEAAEQCVVADDADACTKLIDNVVSAFDTGSGTTVISEVLFEVFEPLLNCSNFSPPATAAFEGLVGKVAAACSPQEALTLYLAILSDAYQ